MKTLSTLIFFTAVCVARAEVKLPAIFSDHMVVQADAAVPVWGWADAGEEITVSFAGQSKTAKANASGKWLLKLDPMPASSEARTMTVRSSNPQSAIRNPQLNDVLVGEVWLASGQSNMGFLYSRGKYSKAESAAAALPNLRMFTVKQLAIRAPQADCAGSWVICTPESVENFSAVAYFFGRDLQKNLNQPVGMIHSSWGGTDIAAWTSEDAQVKVPALKSQLDQWTANDAKYDAAGAKATLEKQLATWKANSEKAKAAGKPAPKKPAVKANPAVDQNRPANLYNGMIAPIIPYALHGAIWYQGEHNCGTQPGALLYRTQLPLLIEDWRTRWGNDFAFAWVQLPNFEQNGFRPVVREAMLQSLKVKNTGMAIAIDIGEANDNHPKNKPEVGRRLSLWALGTVYGQKVPATSGPLPAGHSVQGDKLIVKFDHTNGGLTAKGGELKGFSIAGDDQQWMPAQAKIDGDKVVVSGISKPAAVRYSWAANPDGNLYNGAGLPASPFRTDDWNVVDNLK